MSILTWILRKPFMKIFRSIKENKEELKYNRLALINLHEHIVELTTQIRENRAKIDVLALSKTRATATTGTKIGTKVGSSAKRKTGIKKADVLKRIKEELQLGTSICVIQREILPSVAKRSFYRYLALAREQLAKVHSP